MKRLLRVRERYVHSRRKPKHLTIRHISLLAVLTIMCLYAVKQVSAQTAEPAVTAVSDIKPLQIGDTIPAALWNLPLHVVNHPEGKDTITMSDYRDKKLIILDFWAYYCKPCVLSIDKLDSIRYNMPDEVAIVTLNSFDKPDKVMDFIHKRKWHLTTAVDKRDSLLKNSFYHTPRFGQVWIKDGKLYAFPKNKMARIDLINKIVRNQTVELEMYYPYEQ